MRKLDMSGTSTLVLVEVDVLSGTTLSTFEEDG